MRRKSLVFLFALAAAVALVLGITPAGMVSMPAVASHAGGAAAYSIDMDPTGNTATSLGARQTCARISLNGVQDADEDIVDGVTVDITVSGVPAAQSMIAFVYTVTYNETNFSILAVEGGFFLAALPGSEVMDFNDLLPDDSGDNQWFGVEADFGPVPDATESGSGVLQRLTVGADPGASTGVYDWSIDPLLTVHISVLNDSYYGDSVENARVAVNVACPPADTDGDKVYDVDEAQCGSDPYSAASRPERIDGVYAGVSDDGDAQIDEALPAGIPMADCDGDGFTGTAENFVYSPSTQGDQDPCGTAPSAAPFNAPIGWPADLKGGGFPDSTNKINVLDLTSFTAPVRRLDTSPGDPGYDARWDVVPGNSGQAKDINSVDFNYVSNFAPAMLGSVRALSGPPCPW